MTWEQEAKAPPVWRVTTDGGRTYKLCRVRVGAGLVYRWDLRTTEGQYVWASRQMTRYGDPPRRTVAKQIERWQRTGGAQ